MAIRRIRRSRYTHGGPEMYINVFSLDSDADISKLPDSKKGTADFGPVAVDSMAFVIGDGTGGKIIVLNSGNKWVEV